MSLRTVLLVLTVLVLTAGFAFPGALEKRNEIGLGIILGEPSGLNGQFFWNEHSSVGVTVAWSLRDWFFASGDYQMENRLGDSPPEWRWFWGLGGYIGAPADEGGRLGARIPLGIKYKIPKSVVDVWGEVVPALQIIPDTKAQIQGGIGLTFWIK
jgi:hypothetical protein